MPTSPDTDAPALTGRLAAVTWFTFVVLAALAATGFLVARHVVQAQDDRLLTERATEAASLLSNATHSAESYLPILGAIGGASVGSEQSAFEAGAAALSEAPTTTLAVVADGPSGPSVIAATGPAARVGSQLSGDRKSTRLNSSHQI